MIDFDLSHLQIRSWSLFIGSTISDHVETVPESQNQNLFVSLQHLPRGWLVRSNGSPLLEGPWSSHVTIDFWLLFQSTDETISLSFINFNISIFPIFGGMNIHWFISYFGVNYMGTRLNWPMVVPAEVLVMGGIEGHIIGGPSGWWLVMGRAGSRLNPHWSLGLRWTKIVWKQEKYGKDRSKLSTTRFCPTWTTSTFTRGFLFGGVTRVLACRILSALARRLLEWNLALWCGWENMEPLGNTSLESQKGCHPCCLRRCTVDGWIDMDRSVRHGEIRLWSWISRCCLVVFHPQISQHTTDCW